MAPKRGAAPGGEPEAGLVKDAYGSLWGTTRSGGSGDFGTVFKVDASSGSFECVVQFTDFVGNAPGRLPRGTLAADSAGRMWGLTRDGGPSYYGTVFRVDPSDDSFATILHFTGSHDAQGPLGPSAGLTGDGTGFLWGTIYVGGLADRGTIYKVHPLTGTITTVVDFTGVSGPAPGAAPSGTLVNDGVGFLWGSTVAGGGAGTGSILKSRSAPAR